MNEDNTKEFEDYEEAIRACKLRATNNLEYIVDQEDLSPGDRKLIRDVASETFDFVSRLIENESGYRNTLYVWFALRTHYCEMVLQKLESYGFKIKPKESRQDVRLYN